MPQWLIIALRLTGLGWYVAACIVAGVVGGVWLGKLTDHEVLKVLLVLTGTILGSVVAFYGVYRMVLPAIYGSRRGPQPPSSSPTRDTDHGGNEKS